ncbi:recombinase family protein (plasmid) [Ruegeria sp. SCSIO 43209]|uniref:recombinase family protein n=1 Tax=Ruegeria sp. SCSIO 43209 TaxID=2793010 RepID=UPI001CA83797|nr:recombinase family protein [Ruegeria sp. SCSIO 43209]UAB91543.1 recombinase family protein [Ruegeria sp. SCSIO 43209]
MKIGYRRVSTTDQNLDRQELEGCEKIFEEKLSGANRDRPALRDLIDFAREGDEVIVHSLDRLARDLRDLKSIVDELNDKGVTVEFMQERLRFSPDADDPLSKLQLHLMGAFAEFERSMIRKRQAEGIARAKAKGVYKGRRATIDREQVAEMHAQGLGATEIAKSLGIGRASVYRVLRNE